VLVCVLLATVGARADAADHDTIAPDPSSGCSADARSAADGEPQRLTVGAEERRYLLDAPAARGDRPLPIVFAFHGYRGTAENLRLGTGWGTRAARDGFIAIHPDGHEGVHLLGSVGRGWDLGVQETRDLEFVQGLLGRLERERCVDRRRIYATGMSNGAFFANLLGCKLADRLAAIAPVAGAMPLPACAPARPIPVLLIFGRADDIVPPALMRSARDWWAQVDHCGAPAERAGCDRYDGCAADVVSCEGAQAHAWPPQATEQIWRFFQDHPRR
jgi:polyhydroxybutyrate depolymerase